MLFFHHVRQHAKHLDLVPDGHRLDRSLPKAVVLGHLLRQGGHLFLAARAEQPHERQGLERVRAGEGRVDAVLLARVLLVHQPLFRLRLGEVRVHEHHKFDVVQVVVRSRQSLVRSEAVVEEKLLGRLLAVMAPDLFADPKVLEGTHRQGIGTRVVLPGCPPFLRVVHQVDERAQHSYFSSLDGEPEGSAADQHACPFELVEGDSLEVAGYGGERLVFPLETLLQPFDRGSDGGAVQQLKLTGAPEHGEVVTIVGEDLEVRIVEALLLVPEL
mmetsp:Transcript_8384/g.16449  ORF Transcript_8384/g.16449 Transcript_8384/m.16449 type:complete len:272 (-) Transcript_8384:340-1155(-)